MNFWYNSTIIGQQKKKRENKITFARYKNLLGHAFLSLHSFQPNGGWLYIFLTYGQCHTSFLQTSNTPEHSITIFDYTERENKMRLNKCHQMYIYEKPVIS